MEQLKEIKEIEQIEQMEQNITTTNVQNKQRKIKCLSYLIFIIFVIFVNLILWNIVYFICEMKSLIDNFVYVKKCPENYMWYIVFISLFLNMYETLIMCKTYLKVINFNKMCVNNESENIILIKFTQNHLIILFVLFFSSIYTIINNNCVEIKKTSLWNFFIIELLFRILKICYYFITTLFIQ